MRTMNKRFWPYQFRMLPHQNPEAQVQDIEKYCYENFKSGNWRNYGLYFCFKRHDDAILFALRWSR